jgi:predicted enzyme related to lactoylglutathione lyase
MRADGKIDFVEFPAVDLPATKRFYADTFGWTFADRDSRYARFDDKGLDGGFAADELKAPAAPLLVLYAHNLEVMKVRVRAAGGVITRDIHAVPGGRRFQFCDPSGNELAVWSDAPAPATTPPSPQRNFLKAWLAANEAKHRKADLVMA